MVVAIGVIVRFYYTARLVVGLTPECQQSLSTDSRGVLLHIVTFEHEKIVCTPDPDIYGSLHTLIAVFA